MTTLRNFQIAELIWEVCSTSEVSTSPIVEDRFLCRHVGSNFILTATIVTKQWSGNKCSDVPTKIQTSSYAMDHRDWPGKQWRAEHQARHCTRLTACFSQAVKPFWRLIFTIFCFLSLSFLFQKSTLCWQNRISVDMSNFLKIAVLSPILLTIRLSTTALVNTLKLTYPPKG